MSFGPFRFKYTILSLQNMWRSSIRGDFRIMGIKYTQQDIFCPGKAAQERQLIFVWLSPISFPAHL